jgi:hypothetical protein
MDNIQINTLLVVIAENEVICALNMHDMRRASVV